jgi:predicted aldo/keto reductase-like oxidoreductase
MNHEDQIEENIRTAEYAFPNSLSADEKECIGNVKNALQEKLKIGCTGCGYCMPCPAGVNIPGCFSSYNNNSLYGKRTGGMEYMGTLSGVDGGKQSYASLCKNCGKCEKHCPQNLPIREHLKEVSKVMEPFYFRPLVGMVGGYYKVRGRFSRRQNIR